jgi:anti-sigma regulatory factor (Ser/Thr protein kinase)
LALQYRGQTSAREPLTLRFTNQLAEINRLGQALEEFATQHALTPKTAFELNVVLEEILKNVISYGYDDAGAHEIEMRLSCSDGVVHAQVEDDGRPFNPLAMQAPDTTASLEERPIGGLGIYLVRKLMDSVEYRRQEGKNILTMTKRVATN